MNTNPLLTGHDTVFAAQAKARQIAAGDQAISRKGESGRFDRSNQLEQISAQAGDESADGKKRAPQTRDAEAKVAGVGHDTVSHLCH